MRIINRDSYQKHVKEAAEYIGKYLSDRPKLSIVLGSGLGGVSSSLSDPLTFNTKISRISLFRRRRGIKGSWSLERSALYKRF